MFTNYIEEVYSNKTNFEIMKGYYIPCYNYDFNNSSFLITNEVFESLNSFNAYFNVPDDSFYFDLFIIYNMNYVNPNNYFVPKKTKGENILLSSIESNPKDVIFKLDKIKIVNHNKLFSLFYEKINKKEEEFSSLFSYSINNKNGNY